MQRPIRPEWLIRQANELARRGTGERGQPRNADLRRAASAAYYALFHHIVLSATHCVMPNCGDEARFRFARHYQHNSVRQVCDWVVGPGQPPARVLPAMMALRKSSTLSDVALAFQDLQEARHDADYDHLADFSKPETLTLIDSADDAMSKLDSLWDTPEYESFAAHLVL